MASESSVIIETISRHLPEVEAVYLFGSHGTQHERPDSDIDIAVLLPPELGRSLAPVLNSELKLELERLLARDVDVVNLRLVTTVLQKEVISANRRIYVADLRAADEFEMLTLSLYQKLNEERAAIVNGALEGKRFHAS